MLLIVSSTLPTTNNQNPHLKYFSANMNIVEGPCLNYTPVQTNCITLLTVLSVVVDYQSARHCCSEFDWSYQFAIDFKWLQSVWAITMGQPSIYITILRIWPRVDHLSAFILVMFLYWIYNETASWRYIVLFYHFRTQNDSIIKDVFRAQSLYMCASRYPRIDIKPFFGNGYSMIYSISYEICTRLR